MKFDARYRLGPFRATYTLNYLSPVRQGANTTIETSPTPHIKENIRHNISAAYEIGNYTVRGGVTNLTDEEPSFPTRTYGDILGRQFYVGLRAKF